MRSIALQIEGTYFDSFVYKGRLFLFDFSGVVRTYNWDKMLHMLPADQRLSIALQTAFEESNTLNKIDVRGITRDLEIMEVISKKFERLATAEITYTRRHLKSALIDESQTPFVFPHAGLEMYADYAYCASNVGVERASVRKGLVHAISTRVRKIHDHPSVQVSGYWGKLAVSCGELGLWVASHGNVVNHDESSNFERFSSIESRWHEWLGPSVLTGTYGHAEIVEHVAGINAFTGFPFSEQSYSLVDLSEHLSGTEITCGFRNWVVVASENVIRRFELGSDGAEEKWRIESIEKHDLGRPVVAHGCEFGAIIEFDRGMIIAGEDRSIDLIFGEPVNWRVESRNAKYANQLHIVHDDRIEIRSYNPRFLSGRGIRQEKKQKLRLIAAA